MLFGYSTGLYAFLTETDRFPIEKIYIVFNKYPANQDRIMTKGRAAMFGYVRPYKDELLVREYEQYKAVYCGLCKALGDYFGIGARYTLSFDCTFYAMVAIGISGNTLHVTKGRCTVNPAKKCSFISTQDEEAYKKTSALSILMTYHKCKDNIADDSFLKSFASRLALPLLSGKYKKARAWYPEMEAAVSKAMKQQALAEQTQHSSIDQCCDSTAQMLSVLFEALAGENAGQRMVLQQFGYFLGRWVYLMDAADDLAVDLKTDSFNPFIQKLSLQEYGKGGKEYAGDVKKQAEEACNEVLNRNIAGMTQPLQLLELGDFERIVENIIKKGLPRMQQEILFLHIKEKKHDRSV